MNGPSIPSERNRTALSVLFLFCSIMCFATEIRGVTERADGQAVPGVRVLIHPMNAPGDNDRTVSSDERGSFSVSDLRAGVYRLSAPGAANVLVQIGDAGSVPVELTFDNPGPPSGPSAAPDPPTVNLPDRGAILKELESLKQRIEQLEAVLKQTVPEPAKTAVAAPPPPTPAPPAALPNFQLKPFTFENPRYLATLRNGTPPTGTAGLTPAAAATPVPAAPPDPAPTAAPPDSAATSPADLDSQAAAAQNQPAPQNQPPEPFAFADFTWLTGNPRNTESPGQTKFFTPEIRADVDYVYDYNHPADHSIGGSSEVFREGEVQLTQLGVGGDFNWDNVRARLMTQFGMYAETTPRNDASPARGQWDLDTAYRYISEAYGGYHFNVLDGINVDAGIFMSYVGLFSYYQYDNWAYQPSYVSSNTPWFFNGVRTQIFVNDKLKVEPWFVNGWQSYGMFNKQPGLGLQILYRPVGWLSVLGNQYEGADTLGVPGRHRIHTDDSIQIKYYDNPSNFISKAAMTLTVDAGCEFGQNSGVSCYGGNPNKPSQYFLGFMSYQRFWFHRDRFGLTLGGGAINNPGRYLVLLPPIDGATAITGTPYFTENPGDPFKAWDTSVTFDYMPSQFITWRFEYNHRASNVPYFSGPGGITPPGGNNGNPAALIPGWTPDLRKYENRVTIAILVKF